MAEFKLTQDEYETARWIRPIDVRKKAILWVVSIIALVISIIGKQFAFSILWILLVGFIVYATNIHAKKIQRERIENNPYSLGPYTFELAENSYFVRMGQSEFNLSFDQLGRVHEIQNMYRLDHKSGVCLSVPKRALSNDELKAIKDLKNRITGWPENKALTNW